MSSSALALNPQRHRVAFIQSCRHQEIVDRCRKVFLARMPDAGFADTAIDLFEVAGAFETPTTSFHAAYPA